MTLVINKSKGGLDSDKLKLIEKMGLKIGGYIDFQEDKFSIVCMRAPIEAGGQDMYNVWSYKKIVENEKIEYIQNLSDEHGKIVDPIKVNMPADFPKDTETIVTFKSLGKYKTEITAVIDSPLV